MSHVKMLVTKPEHHKIKTVNLPPRLVIKYLKEALCSHTPADQEALPKTLRTLLWPHPFSMSELLVEQLWTGRGWIRTATSAPSTLRLAPGQRGYHHMEGP